MLRNYCSFICLGRPEKAKKIELDHCTVDITEDLEVGMRRIRHSTQKRAIWIDALSINQNDKDEKSKQIPRMTEIYSYANAVLLWLGECELKDGTPMASTAREIAHFIKSVTAISEHEALENPGPWTTPEKMIAFQQMFRLLEMPWFSRIWVLQEAALAKKAVVLFGDGAVEWATLVAAIQRAELIQPTPQLFQNTLDELQQGVLRVEIARALSENTDDRDTAVSLLTTFLSRIVTKLGASDSRDRLFGILFIFARYKQKAEEEIRLAGVTED
jgi:hypothetical protein